MTVGNRTDVKSACTTQITPTVTVAKHLVALNDNVNDSAVFKKDVVDNINAAATGTATAGFATNDQVNITVTVDTLITVTGLVDGQIGKLTIIKSSTNVITYSGINTVSSGISYGQTRMEFLITSVNSQITATQINEELRTFNLGGTPGLSVVITAQNNYILGRQAHINLNLSCTGAYVNTILFVGTLPFYDEMQAIAKADQFLAIHPQNTNQTEGNFSFFGNGVQGISIQLGNDNNFLVNGTIQL